MRWAVAALAQDYQQAVNKHLFRLLNAIQKSDCWPLAGRRALLRLMGLRVGEGAMILSDCHFIQGPIRLGPGCFINTGCYMEGLGGLELGAGTHLAQSVKLITCSHEFGPPERRAGLLVYQPIRVGNGSWIGAGAVILPGTRIGDGAVVGALSVAKGELAANHVYAGSPAVDRRDLSIEPAGDEETKP